MLECLDALFESKITARVLTPESRELAVDVRERLTGLGLELGELREQAIDAARKQLYIGLADAEGARTRCASLEF